MFKFHSTQDSDNAVNTLTRSKTNSFSLRLYLAGLSQKSGISSYLRVKIGLDLLLPTIYK